MSVVSDAGAPPLPLPTLFSPYLLALSSIPRLKKSCPREPGDHGLYRDGLGNSPPSLPDSNRYTQVLKRGIVFREGQGREGFKEEGGAKLSGPLSK